MDSDSPEIILSNRSSIPFRFESHPYDFHHPGSSTGGLESGGAYGWPMLSEKHQPSLHSWFVDIDVFVTVEAPAEASMTSNRNERINARAGKV